MLRIEIKINGPYDSYDFEDSTDVLVNQPKWQTKIIKIVGLREELSNHVNSLAIEVSLNPINGV